LPILRVGKRERERERERGRDERVGRCEKIKDKRGARSVRESVGRCEN